MDIDTPGAPLKFDVIDCTDNISFEDLNTSEDLNASEDHLILVAPPGGKLEIACINRSISFDEDDVWPRPDDKEISWERIADVVRYKGPYFTIWMNVRFQVLHCEFHDIPADFTGDICEVTTHSLNGACEREDRFIFRAAP